MFMPAGQTGTPMTYMVDGTQYIVVAIGGGSEEIMRDLAVRQMGL